MPSSSVPLSNKNKFTANIQACEDLAISLFKQGEKLEVLDRHDDNKLKRA
jgi:hypothetical protein